MFGAVNLGQAQWEGKAEGGDSKRMRWETCCYSTEQKTGVHGGRQSVNMIIESEILYLENN